MLKTSESSGSAESPSGSSTSSGSLPVRTASNESGVERGGSHDDIDTRSDHHTDVADAVRTRTAQQTADDLVHIASPAVDGEDRGHHTHGGLLTPDDSPSDITQFANNPVDPFHNSSIPIDAKTHSLIQYYKHVYHPAVWHVETRASSKGDYAFQTTSSDVIRSALQSDVDMYALLACMAARQQYVDLRPGYSTDEYLGKALAATRRFIAGRASQGPKSQEEILMVIFHLYAAEGYRNDIAAAKIHMKAAKTIVAAIGGLSKLKDPQMAELLIIGDGLVSAMTLQPCELPCDFDPGTFLQATPETHHLPVEYDLSAICPGLRQQQRNQIPLVLQHIIDEIAELNWVLIHAKGGSPEASKHAMRWISMRSMAIRHRLLGMEVRDPRLDVFRATLVLWIVTTTTLLGLKKLGFVLAPQIVKKLQTVSEQGLDFTQHDVHAWMLSLGAFSAIPGSTHQEWFVGQLVNVLQSRRSPDELDTQTAFDEKILLEELRELQRTFFYHDAVHGEYLQRLAKQIAKLSG